MDAIPAHVTEITNLWGVAESFRNWKKFTTNLARLTNFHVLDNLYLICICIFHPNTRSANFTQWFRKLNRHINDLSHPWNDYQPITLASGEQSLSNMWSIIAGDRINHEWILFEVINLTWTLLPSSCCWCQFLLPNHRVDQVGWSDCLSQFLQQILSAQNSWSCQLDVTYWEFLIIVLSCHDARFIEILWSITSAFCYWFDSEHSRLFENVMSISIIRYHDSDFDRSTIVTWQKDRIFVSIFNTIRADWQDSSLIRKLKISAPRHLVKCDWLWTHYCKNLTCWTNLTICGIYRVFHKILAWLYTMNESSPCTYVWTMASRSRVLKDRRRSRLGDNTRQLQEQSGTFGFRCAEDIRKFSSMKCWQKIQYGMVRITGIDKWLTSSSYEISFCRKIYPVCERYTGILHDIPWISTKFPVCEQYTGISLRNRVIVKKNRAFNSILWMDLPVTITEYITI
jgi:hypothetical protein